jgi:thioredoxin-dependent peroxiredoxin
MSKPAHVVDIATWTVEIGDEVPDFVLESQVGMISWHDMIDGKFALLMTFNKAFDPVMTTEIGMTCKLLEEFLARNIVVAAIGCDQTPAYREWIRDIEELQNVKVKIPLISDPNCDILKQYGCARPVPPTMQMQPISNGLFLIDIDRRLKISMKYATTTGRNIYEIIRAFDALQLSIYHKVVVPANWGAGNEVMVHNDIANDEATAALPKGFVEIKPWFRITPAPDRS